MKKSFAILSAATCVWLSSARSAQASDFWDCVSTTGYCTETCSYSDTQTACNSINNTTSGGFSLFVTSTAGVGVWGGDETSGTGTQGTSVTGVGLYGFSGNSTIAAPPTSAAAIVGYGDATGIYGGYFEAGSANAVYATSSGSDAIHAVYTGGGTGYASGVYATTSSTNGSGVFAENLETSGDGNGVYGGAASHTGFGVYGANTSTSNGGIGIFGTSVNGTGIYGTAGSSPPTDADYYNGVEGSSSVADGGHFLTNVNGKSGVYGDNSTSGTSANSAGVTGACGTAAGSGVIGKNTSSGYGVYGTSSSGTGVYGSGETYGVYGTASAASNGNGVYGIALGTGYGVWGSASTVGVFGGTSGTAAGNYGVYGASGGGSSLAGYFAGPVTVTGEITVGSCSGCTSDIRLKKDVKPLTGAIDQLLALKGVTFAWKNPEEHEGHTGTQTGFIAQDVQKLYPEWVKDGGYTAPDGQKYKTLDTREIEALEVESIRSLKDEADKANARADKAEKEIAALKAHNADNDARLDAIERGHPRAPVSPIGFNPATGLGAFGIAFGAVAGVFVARRKQGEKRA